jgi:nucleotide-binding universal stress UspA family protein
LIGFDHHREAARAAALKRYRRILVAVAPETEEQEEFALGSQLVRLGASVARAEGARLFVVHAWTAFAEKTFRSHLVPSQFAQYMRESRQETAHKLRTFLSKAGEPIPPACVHLVKGRASAVIPRFAKKHAVDLVVMGTVGRSGIPGLLIGNTAEKILTHLESSVLTLKPAEFVSPVSL